MTITRNQTNRLRFCLSGDVGAEYALTFCNFEIPLQIISICNDCILFEFFLDCEERGGTYAYELTKDGEIIKQGNITIQ